MINENLLKLENENIFAKVTEKINKYKKEHPEKDVISLGIGDVSKPIIEPVRQAMHKAIDELGDMKTFKGYGGYYGFDFLREAILENEYKEYGFSIDEIYISDGTKTDSTSILELFEINAKVLVGNPMYPIYRDGAKALNRKVYETNMDENFKMIIPKDKYDIIYICSPNNPIGNAYTYSDLKKWVEYANKNQSVILFDNVYNAFIRDEDVPNSIYEIEGAKKVAIEFRSFSKKASFTSSRCSYYVIPNEIEDGINTYWKRRTINRFNGASYVSSKGALATFEPQAQKMIKENIDYYLENAKIIKKAFTDCGFKVIGGTSAPFMWVKTKDNKTSWEMFDLFINEMNIVIIPGIIFGDQGDHYFRISALGERSDLYEAEKRLKKYYEKEN